MPLDLDDLIARAEALPRPGTPGPWFFDSYCRVASYALGKAYSEWEATQPPESDEEGPEINVAYVPVIAGDTAGPTGQQDARVIAALPEALALIDDLVAWAKAREGS